MAIPTPAGSTPRKSSMGPFWVVMAVAVVLLAYYLVRFGPRERGGSVARPSSPSERVLAPDLGVREASDTSKTLSPSVA